MRVVSIFWSSETSCTFVDRSELKSAACTVEKIKLTSWVFSEKGKIISNQLQSLFMYSKRQNNLFRYQILTGYPKKRSVQLDLKVNSHMSMSRSPSLLRHRCLRLWWCCTDPSADSPGGVSHTHTSPPLTTHSPPSPPTEFTLHCSSKWFCLSSLGV